MDLKKHFSLIENFISYFLFKAIDAVIPLILVPYLTGIVGYENYGIYAFAFSLIFYLQNIIQFGFDLSIVRDIALNRDNKQALTKTYNRALTTQVYLFLFVFLILTILIFSVPKIGGNYIVYIYFCLLLFGELLFPYWFFMGMEKMRFITIINIISKASFALFCFFLITNESDYIYISLYHSIGFVISGILSQIIIYKKFGIAFRLTRFSEVKKVLKTSWSAFLTMVSPTIYHNASIFLVGMFGVLEASGIMEIASKVSGAFGVLNTIMTNVLYPFLNRNESSQPLIRKLLIIAGFGLSLIMYFISEFAIGLWLGEGKNVNEIIKVVKLLSITPLLSSIISAFGVNGLMILKQDKVYSNIIIFGSVIGLLSGLIFIPNYSYFGGAIAIVVALSVKAILSSIFYFKVTRKP